MTIKEIARLSGYSVATVSRVLNNEERVKASTREQINKIIKEYNYIPNVAAKSLRTEKSHTILVVVKSFKNTILLNVIDGIFDELTKRSYKVNIHIPEEGTDYSYYQFLLRSKTVDGIIFVASSIEKEDYLKLQDENVIMCSEYFEELDMEKIAIDHCKAAEDVTEIVISEGYKNIRYIRGSRTSNSMKMRAKGIKNKILSKGLKPSNNLVEICDKKGREFEAFIIDYFKKNEEIDCIMLHSGDRVLEVKKAIERLNKNIKLVSFDDIYSISFIRPKVLRVSSENRKIGEIGVKLLIKKINNEKYEKIHTLKYKIIN